MKKKAFGSFLYHFGRFSAAKNYIALVSKSSQDVEKLGYYGEHLVLLLQSLGLNSCWVGATYNRRYVRKALANKGKVICVIAFGYGVGDGKPRKSKSLEEVANISSTSPEWFIKGLKAALLAPTALNQQKFIFTQTDDKVSLKFIKGPFSELDLGIVKYHFEIGAGLENFKWEF